jgi:hypothetical protein
MLSSVEIQAHSCPVAYGVFDSPGDGCTKVELPPLVRPETLQGK